MGLSVAQAGAVVRRPLSPLERWYWIADQISPLNVIGRVRLRGAVPDGVLRRALGELQARHPLLGVAIAATGAGRDPRFVPAAAEIPLRYVTAEVDFDQRWQREIDEHELAVRLDWRTGPLARAVVVTAGDVHDLVLTAAHCIADGTTVLALLKEWIELAAGQAPVPLPAGGVVEAPEALFPSQHRGVRGAAGAVSAQLRDQLTALRRRPARIAASAAVPGHARRTRFLHRSLAEVDLDALVRACRREETTVHGALAAAMVTAVARDAGTGGTVTIGSPVDFRGELVPPVSRRAAGAYVATVPSFVDCPPGGPLWPMARAVSTDLARRRRSGEHFAQVNTLRWLCPPALAASEPFARRIERHGPGNLCLSNIGRYGFPAAIGHWQLSAAQFAAGISVSGYFVATVNTSHAQLSWNFTYIEEAVPAARAEALADACVDVLVSAAHAVLSNA